MTPGSLCIQFLTTVAARIKAFVLLRGFSIAVLWVVVGLLAVYGFDRAFDFRPLTRLILSASLVLSVVAVPLWFGILPALRRYSLSDVAKIVERYDGSLGCLLITAVEVPGNSAISTKLREQADIAVASLSPYATIKHRKVFAGAGAAFVSLVVFVSLCFAFTTEASVFFSRLAGSRLPYPVKPAFEVSFEPSNRVPVGDPLTVRVSILPGFEFSQLSLVLEGETRDLLVMRPDGERRFIVETPPVMTSLSVRVVGRGKVSPEYFIEAVPRPGLQSMRVTITPPEYTGRESYDLLEGQGNLAVLPGSEVDLNGVSSKPLNSAWLIVDDERSSPLTPKGNSFSGSFSPAAAGRYTIQLVDTESVQSGPLPVYSIMMLPDKAPSIAVERPLSNDKVVPSGAFRLKCTVKDDYGLSSLRLLMELQDSTRKLEPLPFPVRSGAREISLNEIIQLEALALEAGQTIVVRVEAADNRPEPGVTLSDGIVIRVVREYELLEDLQAFITSLKEKLVSVVELERSLAAGLNTDARTSRSWLARHRQAVRDLQNAAQDLETIADAFLLNKLGLEESEILSSMAGVLGAAAGTEGAEISTQLTVLASGRGENESSMLEAKAKALRLAAIVDAQVQRLARFENFGELIRELRRLISRQEELREMLQKLMEKRFRE